MVTIQILQVFQKSCKIIQRPHECSVRFALGCGDSGLVS